MPNKVYVARETRITFEPSGGDEPFTLTSLASGAGRVSDQLERGAGSIAQEYQGVLRTAFGTVPVVNEVLRIYLVEGWNFRNDGTPEVDQGGALGAADAAVSDEDDLIAAGHLIGYLVVPPSPAADTEYVSRPFRFLTAARYLQFAVWNATADALSATAADHELAVWPSPPEIQ